MSPRGALRPVTVLSPVLVPGVRTQCAHLGGEKKVPHGAIIGELDGIPGIR